MTRVTPLADPHRCPSCRTALPSGRLVCSTCDLDLRGECGMRLFALLTEADGLIAQMRAAAVVPTSASPPGAAGQAPAPSPRSTPAPSGMRMSTVPKLLLGLGALCVLVAASLFLPFAWELLGVLGRTVVLVALTAAAAVGARAAGDRGLRATAEALTVVSGGLLVFDLLGARSSGWFGDISGAGFATLVGAVMVAGGTAAALWVRRTRIGVLLAGEVVAVCGSAVLTLGAVGLDAGTLSQRLAVLVPLLGAVAVGTGALRAARQGLDSMAVAAYGHLAVATATWVALGLSGIVGLADRLSWSAMWPGGAGLTLLLTGVYAALPVLDRRRGPSVRAASLSVALVPWALMVTAPAYDEGPGWRTSVTVAVLLLCLVAGSTIPRPWRLSLVPLGTLTAAAAALLVAPLAGAAAGTYVETVVPLWGGAPDSRPANASAGWAGWASESLGSPWQLPAVAAALALALVVTAGQWTRGTQLPERERVRVSAPAALGATAVVLAVSGALLLEAVPVWVVLTVLLAASGTAGLLASRTGRLDLHVGQVVLGATALVLSWSDQWLTLAACLVLLALGVLHHVRGTAGVRVGGGLAVTALLGGALWTGGALLDAPASWTCLVVLLVVSALVLVRGRFGGAGVAGVEAGATWTAVVAAAIGVGSAPAGAAATWLAVYLTVAGAAAALVALTRPDRRVLGWAGGVLLAGASWVRLADVGVSVPEAYTLPSAVALLAAGWWRTRGDAAAGTLSAWSPGLGLALVPSLTWALADPLSWRALLLGLACFALAVVGAHQRVAAPLAWGAGVGAVLVLWEVVPPAVEWSAWLATGLAGAALLALGASWEQRVRDARSALGYLRALR